MTDAATDSRKPNEPSMDEILASIRRIISEENGGADVQQAVPQQPAASQQQPAAQQNVASPARSASQGIGSGSDDRQVQAGPVAQAGADDATAAVGPRMKAAAGASPASGQGGRNSSAGPAQSRASTASGDDDDMVLDLTEMVAPDGSVVRIDREKTSAPAAVKFDLSAEGGDRAAAAAAGQENQALEALVLRALAPVLREWLDKNMPGIVAKVAAREIQKLTGKQD